jgi:two-component system, sensor histidine kinase and response regulator
VNESTGEELGLRILVAEDNIVNQKVTLRMLQNLGCRVDLATNGLEAVAAVERVPYDVILMDCQMPELDGYGATRSIRGKEKEGARLPIIAMTANTREGERERCIAAGMDDYVAKPVSTRQLGEMLRAWGAKTRRGNR